MPYVDPASGVVRSGVVRSGVARWRAVRRGPMMDPEGITMSRQEYLWAVAVAVAVGGLVAGCGSTPTTPTTSTATASSPDNRLLTSAPSSAPATSVMSSAATPPTQPTSTVMPARLPRDNSGYSRLLIDAWGRGDRIGAARVATPAAIAATFAHAPIRGLVNYSCEDGTPVICGYIGENDVRVEVSVDAAKVARGADQAIIRVRLAMP